MAWMGDYNSMCATCKHYGTHQGKEPCKSCEFLGIITEGNPPSNYVEKEERSQPDNAVSMEIFKFNFKDSINYIDSDYATYFIVREFQILDSKYDHNGYLYLRQVLEEFGMTELAKTVPIWLGWDKTRDHEFKHYFEEILETFDLMVTINPYDISKEALNG